MSRGGLSGNPSVSTLRYKIELLQEHIREAMVGDLFHGTCEMKTTQLCLFDTSRQPGMPDAVEVARDVPLNQKCWTIKTERLSSLVR